MPAKKQPNLVHRELLEVIAKAAGARDKTLILSGQHLTELPAEIGQLSSLKTLELHRNQLTSLPESISQLTSLEKLDLSGNQLTSLPESISQLSSLKTLDLSGNQLTLLPEWIGQLTSLQGFDLSGNQLTSLPESISQLTSLERLDLSGNQLTSLPEWIGQLSSLETLELKGNQLTSLPESISQLTSLQGFDLSGNQLTSLPEWIGQLTSLQGFHLSGNQLTSLPESIGQLTSLERLDLSGNQLTSLPGSLARLEELWRLRLDHNPLNPLLRSVCERGLYQLRAYLNSLEELARREELHEAKLVLVGEGAVGKTSLLKVMTGQKPLTDEPTTHGVNIEIQSLRLPHPEREGVEIHLNAWDFGGQEVYRVTHQFFFSRRSVYLLVWEPRRGIQQCQVEDWLKLIRLRVGDEARVIIVSTHCRTGERIGRIDKPVLRRDFGSIIVDFVEVDSFVDDPNTGEKVGVAALKKLIAEAARDLEQMGMPFNRNWLKAREEFVDIRKPHIAYEEFAAVCERHGLNTMETKTLAFLMRDLGYIVYYGEDERLENDVVMEPEWLIKAIGFVLEDRTTQEMDGILPDNRLTEVWFHHSFKGEPRYEPELYPLFLRIMEKYDVSYRLEKGDASLVAQHVPQVRPDLPWQPEKGVASGMRRIALVTVMDEAPPGLVPWMIVRTHQYAYEWRKTGGRVHRLHWQKGMFLRNKSHGEAMLELRGREFHIYAQAVWPEFFMEVLRKTLHKLITDNWPGLKGRYFFAVPCQAKLTGSQCDGRFYIDALRQFLEEGDETIRCQVCRTRQNIVGLLYGFQQEDSREQLARIEAKLDLGFNEVLKEFNGLESRVASYVMAILHAIASESKDGPRLFTIEPVDGNWKQLVTKHYRLHLWCEAEGCQHPVFKEGKGVYRFTGSRQWVKSVAPYANLIAGVLRTVLPVAAPAANMLFGPETMKELDIKNHLDIMKEATDKLMEGNLSAADPSWPREGPLSESERSGILALHEFLHDEDRHHERLGLRRLPTYTGNYLWLCETHYKQVQSKIPERMQ